MERPSKQWRWEVNLLGSKQINAFCMPGGKIAFYTGILDQLKLSDDEAAMIMGHEMAHALREHARARIAKSQGTGTLLSLGAQLLGLGQMGDLAANIGTQLLTLRFSREDETDADLVGLELAARGGYNPQAPSASGKKWDRPAAARAARAFCPPTLQAPSASSNCRPMCPKCRASINAPAADLAWGFLVTGLTQRAAFFTRAWWRAFRPGRTRINTRERLRIVIGSLLGILVTGLLCHLAGPDGARPALAGGAAGRQRRAGLCRAGQPDGAALERGGRQHPVGAGRHCGRARRAPAGLPRARGCPGVATAIALMLALRCLHPPGGATALMMVLGGVSDPVFAFYPVMLNSLLLVAVGIAYNNATRRAYPHTQLPPPGAAFRGARPAA
jgi:hypothetical protein